MKKEDKIIINFYDNDVDSYFMILTKKSQIPRIKEIYNKMVDTELWYNDIEFKSLLEENKIEFEIPEIEQMYF